MPHGGFDTGKPYRKTPSQRYAYHPLDHNSDVIFSLANVYHGILLHEIMLLSMDTPARDSMRMKMRTYSQDVDKGSGRIVELVRNSHEVPIKLSNGRCPYSHTQLQTDVPKRKDDYAPMVSICVVRLFHQ